MIDEIINNINTNVTNALKISLEPLVDEIKKNDNNITLINNIIYNMPIYQDLEKKYHHNALVLSL